MKFSALLIIMAAVSAQAQVWRPAVNMETIAAVAAPAPASPARALPRDGANYSGAEEVLLKEFSIPGITLDMPEKEVAAQMTGGSAFCPEQALRLALGSFLSDHRDASGPLGCILGAMGAAQPGKAQVKTASEKLLRLMNMSGSELKLAVTGTIAPRGESVRKAWLFRLRLGYSDRYYWAVVDRKGGTVYNYGAD